MRSPSFLRSITRELANMVGPPNTVPIALIWGPFDGLTLHINRRTLLDRASHDGLLILPLDEDDSQVALYSLRDGRLESATAGFKEYAVRLGDCEPD